MRVDSQARRLARRQRFGESHGIVPRGDHVFRGRDLGDRLHFSRLLQGCDGYRRIIEKGASFRPTARVDSRVSEWEEDNRPESVPPIPRTHRHAFLTPNFWLTCKSFVHDRGLTC